MRARLALTNTAIIVVAAMFVVLVLLPVRSYFRLRAIDERLSSIADSQPASIDPLVSPPVFVQTDAANGVILTRSANMGSAQLPLAQRGFSTVSVDGHRLRIYQVAGTSDMLELATPLEDDLPRGPAVPGLAIGAMVGVLTATVVGWLLARIALRPIERLSAVVADINSTSDLSLRVPVDDLSAMHPDAVQRLALGFNAMLGRLEVATRQLDSTLEAQRQFVAEASHQLRTPLTSLEGNVQLLARLCAEDCPAAAVGLHQEILTDLDQETDRMARVVNNLLALARADAQQHLVLRPLELEPLMREAFRTARALSESVTVRLEDVPLDVRINADRDRFVELLTILLDNAVRYSPPDGEVVLRALADDSQVRVEVADNGPGIDPDERVRIFERFYRARATSSVEGAGLGLAVARWIAAEHRARLTVIDNVPSGSVFQVWMERS